MAIMLDTLNNDVKHVEHFIMDNVRMTLQNRLNQLFNEYVLQHPDFKQADLSRALDVSRAAITDWMNGKTKTIAGENAHKVAKFFGANAEWVQTGKGPAYKTAIKQRNIEPGPDITGRVPLISWVQAGEWAEVIDHHLPGQADEWRLTTAKCSKHAYALRIVGDSMTNPYGSPSIPDGYIVIVEPERPAKNGDIVIARLDDSMEATIKKLVIEGSTRYLKPLNPSYPVIHINGNCTICGVVIKVEFDL